MKIAQVCPYDFSRPGGVKNHIESLAKYLTLAGHNVKIIAPLPGIGGPNIYHFGSNRSLNLGGTKIDVNIALGKESKALENFLNTEQFDIIHFHTFWNPVVPLQVRLLSRSKYVTTFHDTPKSEFIGKTIMPIAAKVVFALMDAIISVSKTQASFINRFSNREISIIPNGIDLAEYRKTILPIEKYKDDKFNLLFLGRLEKRKGLMYAIRSFQSIKAQNDDIRLIIAGDGDERATAEKYIKTNNLKDVEMLGFVSEEDKRKLLKTCDLYVAPALFGESFGIVLLEAMALGTPMAGFANQGYLNVLSEKQQEYFVEPKDLEGLTYCIQRLMKLSDQRDSLSQHGYEIATAYDWEIHSRKIEEIYDKLLNP